MKQLVENNGWSDLVSVDSAGTIGYHTGNAADRRMRAAAKMRGLELTSRARQVTVEDLQRFDRIIAMDAENLRDLIALNRGSDTKIELLSAYLGDPWPSDVPDPYYGGDEGFGFVLDMLEQACPKILASLTNGNN